MQCINVGLKYLSSFICGSFTSPALPSPVPPVEKLEPTVVLNNSIGGGPYDEIAGSCGPAEADYYETPAGGGSHGPAAANSSDDYYYDIKRIRWFTVWCPETNETSGRYSGKTPYQAASKAYTKQLQALKAADAVIPDQTIIYIREYIDNILDETIHKYSCERIALDPPQTITVGTGACQKTITYSFRNLIRKL